MPADFEIKAWDRLPYIQAVLKTGPDPDTATAEDVTSATSIAFIMLAADESYAPLPGTPKVNAAATKIDAPNGVVRYNWAAGDTDTPGQYVAEWEVLWGDGKTQTFPTSTYHTIDVVADLDDAP